MPKKFSKIATKNGNKTGVFFNLDRDLYIAVTDVFRKNRLTMGDIMDELCREIVSQEDPAIVDLLRRASHSAMSRKIANFRFAKNALIDDIDADLLYDMIEKGKGKK